VVKVHWITIVKRIMVERKLGEANEELRKKINKILPQALSI
jgi:hypothetical protein